MVVLHLHDCTISLAWDELNIQLSVVSIHVSLGIVKIGENKKRNLIDEMMKKTNIQGQTIFIILIILKHIIIHFYYSFFFLKVKG